MDTVPVLPDSELDTTAALCAVLNKRFEEEFKKLPAFYSRVPGRVNLIGEHIDYCGFSVLPMAIEKDIILAVSVNEKATINLINFDSKYPPFSTLVKNLVIDKSCPKWYHYFICGYQGISEKYDLKYKGFDILVKGTVPPSSGLSSSSALVCASALAIAFANSVSLPKMEIADLCAKCECYIGTQGGGMDQAIGFLAMSGTAKLIEFNPIRAYDVCLPEGVTFVVSNSCVAMNKAATSQYNIRVVECRIAAKVLAKLNGFSLKKIKILSDVPLLLKKDVSEMRDVVTTYLPKDSYSREELRAILEFDHEEFLSLLSENTQDLQIFKLRQRALHVYEEAARVRKFKKICETGDNKIVKLGHLMNESHQSCRDLYECSHPDLDELVDLALEAGAVGSRLTGAGWGGCCISLVLDNQVEQFMNHLKESYYVKKLKMNKEEISNALFITKPSCGARIFTSGQMITKKN